MRQQKFDTRENLEINLKTKDSEYVNKKTKTINFWLKKDNRWNEPSFASEKIFKFYHEKNEKYKEKKQEGLGTYELKKNPHLYKEQDEYKFFVKRKRREAKERLMQRKKERILLQKESLQMVPDTDTCKELEDKINSMSYSDKRKLIIKRSGARTILKKKPDNVWNDFNDKCDKHLGLYLRPMMLENEDKAVELMKQKIKKKQKEDFYKGLYEKVKHDVIRYRSKRSKSVPGRRVIKKPYMHFYKKRMKGLMKKSASPSNSLGKIIPSGSEVGDSTWDNNMEKISGSVYERLNKAKQTRINSFDIEFYDEFKDMMIRDVTPHTAYFDNNYIKTLVKISKTAKERTRTRNRSVGYRTRDEVKEPFPSYSRKNSMVSKKRFLSFKKRREREKKKMDELQKEKNSTFGEMESFDKKFTIMKSGDKFERKFRVTQNISEIKGGNVEENMKSGLFTKTDDVLEMLPFINKDSIIEARRRIRKNNHSGLSRIDSLADL